MNYLELVQMADDYLNNSPISVEHEINGRKEMQEKLNKIFGSYWDQEVELSDMRSKQGGEYEFLYYSSKKKDSTKNFVIIKNDKPLYKYEYTICGEYGCRAGYEETKRTIYLQGSRRIENRMTNKTWNTGGNKVEDIVILNYKGSNYSKHKYTLYTINKEIISFRNHDQIWIKGEETFYPRLELVTSNILKAEEMINDKVNCIFGGVCVKQYSIKRKK